MIVKAVQLIMCLEIQIHPITEGNRLNLNAAETIRISASVCLTLTQYAIHSTQ